MDYVRAQSETDPTAIMAINFATWGDTKDEAKRNLAALTKAIEGWGVSGVSKTYGNPGSALIASVPGLTTATPGSLHYPPLSEGLRMLPLNVRPVPGMVKAISTSSRSMASCSPIKSPVPCRRNLPMSSPVFQVPVKACWPTALT